MPESMPDSPDAKRGGIKEVYSQLGIQVSSVNVKDLNYEYFYNLLKANAHFLLMSGGTSMGHTRVVYGVGDPTPNDFKVFDPLRARLLEHRLTLESPSEDLVFPEREEWLTRNFGPTGDL
eukprot:gene2243-2963_t